ncbi:MAG: Rieske 2Fe-2S domain-containing protein [Gammaproteobacteria bacterium]|nr:Rieske 2Fe-2S domain-containing protein [Gammaproteobacteria bacterium]
MLKIAQTNEFEDLSSRGFTYEKGGESISGFVVHQYGQYFAYVNQCPHTGAPLDWVEHQFLDSDKEYIQCAVHDARFVIDSGECVLGPCSGQSLKQLPIVEKDGDLLLEEI